MANILVMDDEELIRTVMTDLVECLGHSCITAKSGENAIEIYKNHLKSNKKIDCVILDVFVKGGLGAEPTADEILKLNKNAIIVVSSGDSEEPVMRNFENYGFSDVLEKPCKIKDIENLFERHNIN